MGRWINTPITPDVGRVERVVVGVGARPTPGERRASGGASGERVERERGARRASGERVGSEWGAREEWWRVREGEVGGEREGSEARASGESGGERG